jgi:peptidoglycan/LPS O-acetylase OafA/YrhL
LPALTGLRFFAATGVFFTHYWSRTQFEGWDHGTWLRDLVNRILTRGFVGVPLFFLLSGFVLAYSTTVTAATRRDFWIARFARIYPTYVLSLIVALPLLRENLAHYGEKFPGTTGRVFSTVAALLVTSLTQSWVPRAANFWNAASWSLSVEAFFYLLFPFLVGASWVRSLARRPVVPTVAALWLCALAVPVGMILWKHGPLDEVTRGTAVYFPPFNLPTFIIGMILGIRYRAARGSTTPGSATSRRSWLAPLGLVFVLAVLGLGETIPPELLNPVLLPGFALLIYGLAKGGAAMGRFLSLKPLVFLGDASYAFYLLHCPVTMIWYHILGINIGLYPPASEVVLAPWQFASAFALCILVSGLVFHWIERPCRSLLRRVLSRLLNRNAAGALSAVGSRET